MVWQSIESAPKDGRAIIVFHAAAAKWSKVGPVRVASWRGGCWRAGSDFLGVDAVTHWMPLPPSPQTTGFNAAQAQRELTGEG